MILRKRITLVFSLETFINDVLLLNYVDSIYDK